MKGWGGTGREEIIRHRTIASIECGSLKIFVQHIEGGWKLPSSLRTTHYLIILTQFLKISAELHQLA
jgi:hypothetical protein